MSARELAAELLLPLRSLAVFLTLLAVFFLLQVLALIALHINIVIALVISALLIFFVLPGLSRYLLDILRWRSFGRQPEPFAVELLSWLSQAWELLPILLLALSTYLAIVVGDTFGATYARAVVIAIALLLPASLMVLGITRSALESLNPATLYRIITRSGYWYLLAPAFLLLAIWLIALLQARLGSLWLTELVALYLLFASFALFGGIARRLRPEDELTVRMPDSVPAEVEQEQQLIEREGVLNHAYGLISRGGRDKGLAHIYASLAEDRYEDAGWQWFFEQMLRWEDPAAALAFGQRYLHELLRDGETVKAVKLMLRCRLINPAFRPLHEDRESALSAAIACQNDELASFLR